MSRSLENSCRDMDTSKGIQKSIASKAAEYLEESLKMKEKSNEEKKRQKDILKALETPEEKRLRRLAKKEAKDRKRKLQMGWDEEYMGYTNADNPFGDANLHMTFNWKKKYEKNGFEEHLGRRNSKIESLENGRDKTRTRES